MAFGTFDLKSEHANKRYPAAGAIGGNRVKLRLMGAADGPAMLSFARALPEHDILFLRRDITTQEQIDAWLDEIERGTFTTLLLTDDDDQILGYGTVDQRDLDWTHHVAELRVLVAPAARGTGIARLLTEEAFRVALELGVEKIIGQMTVDQVQAIAVFRNLGFQPEALLRDHVKDRDGKKHDLVILSHDVASFGAKLEAFGVTEALGS
jgi:L-amino acid N-acyltransferase YncA